MGLSYDDLDDMTRQRMLSELDLDIANGSLYYSKWFSQEGKSRYADLCRAAIESGTDDTLAAALTVRGIYMTHYEKNTPKGGSTVAAVPHNAPTMLAEGEFNRYYLRGLCARIIAEGGGRVEIYRARHSTNARSSSEALIGATVDAADLLADLRANLGVDLALGLPPGPNSGLSGRKAPAQ